MRSHAALVVLALLCPALTIAQQSMPQQILERAIAAHGGVDRLSRSRCEQLRFRGNLHVGGKPIAFSNDVVVQLPGRYRSSIRLQQGDRDHTIVHSLDGDKATILADGQPLPLSPVHHMQLQQTLQLEQAMRLVPLLNDPAVTLQALPIRRYNDHVFVGLRVSRRGQRDLALYFDQTTGLLVKTEQRLDGPNGKEIVQEAYYANHRDFDGQRRAGQIVVFRDGQKVMEAELIQVRPLNSIEQVDYRP
jgi:hypothetical protein